MTFSWYTFTFQQTVKHLFIHILVLQECWALRKSRIPLKQVLGGVRIVALAEISHELNKTEPAEVLSISEGSVFPDYFNIMYR